MFCCRARPQIGRRGPRIARFRAKSGDRRPQPVRRRSSGLSPEQWADFLLNYAVLAANILDFYIAMRRNPGKSDAERPSIKPIAWWGSSLEDVRTFPDEARREAGFQLGRLQEGKEADDWKPMTTVGAGTIEIRIHTGTEHRVFVVTKFGDQIHVLHAFAKKSQKTPQRDIDLAKKRYSQLAQQERKG